MAAPPDEPAAPAVQRVHLATSVPDEAQALLGQLFGTRLQVAATEGTDWVLSLDGVDTGRFSSVRTGLPAHLQYVVGGRGEGEDFVIVAVSGGRVAFDRQQPGRRGRRVDRYLPGDVFVGNQPQALSTARTEHVLARTVTLPRQVVAEAAALAGCARGPGGASRPAAVPVFTTMTSSGPEATRRWRWTTRYVDDMLTDPVVTGSPMLLAGLGRLLAQTALSVFPNTLTRTSTAQDRRDAHPQSLRRAIAFVEANPDVDITTADIARAAFVSPRAVQVAFRRHLGTTPQAHLRRVRLEQAHRQLQDAVPAGPGALGTTVAQVAARWGFTPSRFTEHYRAVYGVLPSQTLRS